MLDARQRLKNLMALCGLLAFAGCVFVDRFTYVVLEENEAIQTEGTVLPNMERVHLVSVSPMPALYTLARPNYTVRFVRARDTSGGLVISAFSPEGVPLQVTSDQPRLGVPGYGPCRTHYRVEDPPGLLFFDQCPEDLSRSFILSFNIATGSGHVNERLAYRIQSDGYWWTPDSL